MYRNTQIAMYYSFVTFALRGFTEAKVQDWTFSLASTERCFFFHHFDFLAHNTGLTTFIVGKFSRRHLKSFYSTWLPTKNPETPKKQILIVDIITPKTGKTSILAKKLSRVWESREKCFERTVVAHFIFDKSFN